MLSEIKIWNRAAALKLAYQLYFLLRKISGHTDGFAAFEVDIHLRYNIIKKCSFGQDRKDS